MNNNKEKLHQGLPPAGEIPAVEQPRHIKGIAWLSAGQFAFSLILIFLLVIVALISSLVVLWGASNTDPGSQHTQIISALLFAAGLGFAGFLLIPSAIHSGKRIFSHAPPAVFEWDRMVWLAVIFPIPIYVGYLIQTGPEWSQYFLPVFHVLANGTSIVWVLNLARSKFPSESAQRSWGVFGTGLILTPAVTFVIEILILVVIGIFWLFLIQANPDLEQDILYLANLIYESSPDPEISITWAGKFVAHPEVAATILLYFSLLIPLVEELLKPLAVYFLMGRKLQPWQGFVAGATAGAGYALFENLTIGAGVETWSFVMISRIGTAAIHILATGLVGWGLACALTERKYLRLFGSFIAAVSLHGVWNGLNILSALAEIPSFQDQISPFILNIATYSPAGLIVLALGSMFGLKRANSRLRRAIIAQD